MGRRRRRPHWDKADGGLGVDGETSEIIEERLGHRGQVCTSCQARNPKEAEKCRKCGHTDLRRKAADYRAAGTEGANI